MNARLRTVVFACNFPHWKTQEGIINLCINNLAPDLVIAQNFRDLRLTKSNIRVSPRSEGLANPSAIAAYFAIAFLVADHDSEEAGARLRELKPDLGIILGARILKPATIEHFRIGILNLHPGLIPENRGLDNLKWAIIDMVKQGVTSHLIDHRIDRGLIADRQSIKVYEDDTLIDIALRLREREQLMMLETLQRIRDGSVRYVRAGTGRYHRSMPPEIEARLIETYAEYKLKYDCLPG